MRSVPLCAIITVEAGRSEGERTKPDGGGGGGGGGRGGGDEITPVLVAD